VKDTHAAIRTAFTDAPDKLDNQEILHPMGQSGLKAALENDAYQNMPMPGMDALRKKALAEARTKVRAEAKKANAARLTKETEEKARLAAIEKKDKENAWKASTKAPTPSPTPHPTRHRYENHCCCWAAFDCFGQPSCYKCPPHKGNRYVGIGECGTSRRCNRL
jgi:hypothetical protein